MLSISRTLSIFSLARSFPMSFSLLPFLFLSLFVFWLPFCFIIFYFWFYLFVSLFLRSLFSFLFLSHFFTLFYFSLSPLFSKVIQFSCLDLYSGFNGSPPIIDVTLPMYVILSVGISLKVKFRHFSRGSVWERDNHNPLTFLSVCLSLVRTLCLFIYHISLSLSLKHTHSLYE